MLAPGLIFGILQFCDNFCFFIYLSPLKKNGVTVRSIRKLLSCCCLYRFCCWCFSPFSLLDLVCLLISTLSSPICYFCIFGSVSLGLPSIICWWSCQSWRNNFPSCLYSRWWSATLTYCHGNRCTCHWSSVYVTTAYANRQPNTFTHDLAYLAPGSPFLNECSLAIFFFTERKQPG